MRHKSGWRISPTLMEHSGRHNLYRISRVSTGRLFCKTKLLGTDTLRFCNKIGIITKKINNKSTFIARFKARKVVWLYSNFDHFFHGQNHSFWESLTPLTQRIRTEGFVLQISLPVLTLLMRSITVLQCIRWNSSTTLMTHNHDVAFFTTYFRFGPIWVR